MSTQHITTLITCFTLLCFSHTNAHEHEKSPKENSSLKKLQTSDYELWKLRGWTIHLEKSIHTHPRGKQATQLLDTKLAEIEKIINPQILTKLKQVPIWLNNDIRKGACYHPNPQWLKQNNRIPEKARSIEIENVNTFIDWSTTQPMMMLHELAHAYHHRVHQFKNPVITAAFKQAVASKSYEKVKHINGKTKRHYALTNEKEYFSECTEAYFGKNDFYPFTKADLKKHDPTGYAMVETLWKIKIENTDTFKKFITQLTSPPPNYTGEGDYSAPPVFKRHPEWWQNLDFSKGTLKQYNIELVDNIKDGAQTTIFAFIDNQEEYIYIFTSS